VEALKLYQKTKVALRLWLLRRLPSCGELAPVMSESMERRLTLRERVTLKLHLIVCRWCVWYFRQLHSTRATLRRKAATISEDEPSKTQLSHAARERIKRALDHQAR
jgi:hypothetical protein